MSKKSEVATAQIETNRKVVYMVSGGGQKIRQNEDYGNSTVIILKDSNCDWVKKAKCNGQNSFTNYLWADDLEMVKKWAMEWSYFKKLHFEIVNKN
jgi:hypothetical protein